MRKFLEFLTVSLLFVGAGMLIAQPAQAKPSCGSGYICIYDDLGGTSLMAKKYWTDWTQSICYGMSSYDNRVSYVVNDSAHDIIVSTGYSCSGTTGVWYANNYGPMNATWNNTVSSWYRVN
jgi:hypothetical protein